MRSGQAPALRYVSTPRTRPAQRAVDSALERRPVFFLHIPKTAGTSLWSAIVNQFPVGRYLLGADFPCNQTKDPNQYQFVHGHLPYDYAKRFITPPIIVTFLRDPIDRAISQYYFLRNTDLKLLSGPQNGARAVERQTAAARKARENDLESFIRKEPALAAEYLGNVQTRFLLDARRLSARGSGPDDHVFLEEAIGNLKRCRVVGLTERADESLALLCHHAQLLPMRRLLRTNVTGRRPSVRELSPSATEALAALTHVDAQLYDCGQRLFERQLQECEGVNGQDEPRPRIEWLADASDFTFDQAICGQGWYPRERSADTWMCWSGPEREAWIDVAVHTAGEHLLRFTVIHFLRPQSLAGMQIRVNGQPVPVVLWHRRSGHRELEIEANVPASALAAHPRWARITFVVPEVARRCDVHVRCSDRRTVGVAISRIQLLPARRVARGRGPRYMIDGEDVSDISRLLPEEAETWYQTLLGLLRGCGARLIRGCKTVLPLPRGSLRARSSHCG